MISDKNEKEISDKIEKQRGIHNVSKNSTKKNRDNQVIVEVKYFGPETNIFT